MGNRRVLVRSSWACLALVAAGCGGFNTKGSSPRDPVEYARLVGDWDSGCAKSAAKPDEYQKAYYRFTAAGAFRREVTTYADAACAKPLFKRIEVGTAKLTGQNQDVRAARDIEYSQFTTVEAQALSPEGAARMNAEKFCDIVDWKDKEAHGVTGFKCRGVTINQDTKVKDMVEIRKDSLRFGRRDAQEGTLGLGRPKSLDQSMVFHKRK